MVLKKRLVIISVLRFLIVDCAYTAPFYNWPLVPGNEGLEIVYNQASQVSKCGTMFEEGASHPNLYYPSVALSGSMTSRLNIYIHGGNSGGGMQSTTTTPATPTYFEDFGFSILFQPANVKEGTLLHYKVDPSLILDSDVITEIRVFFTSTNFVTELYTQGVVCLTVSVSNSLTENTWFNMGVSSDYSTKKVELIFDDDVAATVTADVKYTLALPGTVRLGGGFDDTQVPFQGSMSCLHLYSNKIKADEFEDAYSECTTANWPASPAAAGRTCLSVIFPFFLNPSFVTFYFQKLILLEVSTPVVVKLVASFLLHYCVGIFLSYRAQSH